MSRLAHLRTGRKKLLGTPGHDQPARARPSWYNCTLAGNEAESQKIRISICRSFYYGSIMGIKMPNLCERATYTVAEFSELGFNDEVSYFTARNHYTSTYGCLYFGERDDQIVLAYRTLDISVIEPQIKELDSLFLNHPEHLTRVSEIKKLLQQGEVAWPILILKEHEPFDFHDCKIREGNHRAVAHLRA
jgi:hypothetical protein